MLKLSTHPQNLDDQRSLSTSLLSVVIIARNEEDHIAQCIQSVMTACADLKSCEIVLVDGNSEDRTVAIARTYPLRIVHLSSAQRCCPALGRYVGTRLTYSRFVLFVDGDSTIEQRWVTSAIQFLETRPEASGVAGREDQIYFGKGEVVGFKADYFRTGNSEVQVKEFGGNAMYRRKALEEVGSFNPYIRSYEEAELGARLRKAGWVLVRIPVMMALHYTAIPDTLEEYRRRFRGHFFTGQGQVLRISIRQGTFWEHARGLNRVVFYILWITLGGLAMLGSAGFGTLVPILTWLSGGLVLLVCFVIRSRSLVKPFRMLLDWSVCSLPLIWGFLLSARDPEDFSLNEAIATDTAAPHTRRTRKGCLDDTGAKVLST